jgi:hypothetical protein
MDCEAVDALRLREWAARRGSPHFFFFDCSGGLVKLWRRSLTEGLDISLVPKIVAVSLVSNLMKFWIGFVQATPDDLSPCLKLLHVMSC